MDKLDALGEFARFGTWSYDLESAAYRHSSDMANSDFMSHTGSDGSNMSDRVNATGYAWSAIGEHREVSDGRIQRNQRKPTDSSYEP